MGLQQSKDELLYEQVNCGNIESIRTLRSEGAGLEWTDKEGKTSLVVACMSPELYDAAKILIELGANVNAYSPGHSGGTPLHHAARRGLEQTVKLLLQNGANALVMNDDFRTPLDIGRAKGYSNIVRAIEEHLCLFSGWLREIYAPGFLELLSPQLLSRRVWAVVLPCGSRNHRKPFRLELAIYADSQDAQPHTIVPLWRASLEEPNLDQPDPAVIISNISRIPRRWKRRRGIKPSQEARRTEIKFVPVEESETLQLQQFSNACRGIPQVMHRSFNIRVPTAPATAPSTSSSSSEDEGEEELAVPTNASPPPAVDASTTLAYLTTTSTHTEHLSSSEFSTHKANGSKIETFQSDDSIPSPVAIPSAPPESDDGPIHYPSIDTSPVDISSASAGTDEERGSGSAAASCTICLDAPVEGACIPCGHMVGCMMCLNEINSKKWGCPLCRSTIDQVVRIYSV